MIPFVQEAETVWDTTTTPKTTASFNVLAGDRLVAYMMTQSFSGAGGVSGGSLVWTLKESVNLSTYGQIWVWEATVDVAKSMTVSFTNTGGQLFGGNVLTFRGSAGVGATAKGNQTTGAVALNITTTKPNSAIVVLIVDGDFAATDGAGRVWRTNAGPFTETTYGGVTIQYVTYGGFHADAGPVGTYTVGITTPSSQFAFAALEITPAPSGIKSGIRTGF